VQSCKTGRVKQIHVGNQYSTYETIVIQSSRWIYTNKEGSHFAGSGGTVQDQSSFVAPQVWQLASGLFYPQTLSYLVPAERTCGDTSSQFRQRCPVVFRPDQFWPTASWTKSIRVSTTESNILLLF
jgi:hypothetical protein